MARAHVDGTDGLAVWDLVTLGWPGERVNATAATNRVYVTINRMRAAGLGELLERADAGYRLAPSLLVKRADA